MIRSLPTPDAIVGRIPLLWRMLAAMLVLAGLILMLVESRARILRSGVEIRLQTAPVDPRDLFRGDYVVLGYTIGRLDTTKLAGDKIFARDQWVYVRVAPGAGGFAEARGVYRALPPVGAGETVLKARVLSTSCARDEGGIFDCAKGVSSLNVAYGLESYFVPQGTGLAIERTERARIEVVAAVDASGAAAIKRLLIDGKRVHDEPPY